ncbi:MAG: chromosome partitioning protein, partial [Verrucomicrobia bacterium]|nr:chromosome partitioning protein [Verrucomicrobiota bacterium]
PRVMVPEGKLDARWFRLFARFADITADTAVGTSIAFTHEMGVIPTRDAQVVQTFSLLQKMHPAVLCLVDGDAAGTTYAGQLAALPLAPTNILQWPTGWVIEDVVGWVIDADPTVLADAQLTAAGVANTLPAFLTELKGPRKSDEVVHDLVADVISTKPACMRRIRHLLQLISDIAAGRAVATTAADHVIMTPATTKLWTFKNAVPGL